MNAIMSIKPEFVSEMIKGTKKFEYRKSFLKEIPEKCYIYSTLPVGKVVGYFTIRKVHRSGVQEIWIRTKKSSGITKSFYNAYYSGKEKAVAIEIENLVIFDEFMDYSDFDKKGKVPQSYKKI